jgi:hypothetical protein
MSYSYQEVLEMVSPYGVCPVNCPDRTVCEKVCLQCGNLSDCENRLECVVFLCGKARLLLFSTVEKREAWRNLQSHVIRTIRKISGNDMYIKSPSQEVLNLQFNKEIIDNCLQIISG